MFAGTWGVVQWMLEESVWGLWVTGSLFPARGGTNPLSQVGKRLAAPQAAT